MHKVRVYGRIGQMALEYDEQCRAGVLDALGALDAQAIADMGLYPLDVRVGDEEYDVETAEDFIAGADASMTPELTELVGNQDIADLIVSSDGVGFDEGALWMTNVCLDDACAETRWGILAINN